MFSYPQTKCRGEPKIKFLREYIRGRDVEGAVPYNQLEQKIKTDKNLLIFVGEEQVSRKSEDFPNREIEA